MSSTQPPRTTDEEDGDDVPRPELDVTLFQLNTMLVLSEEPAYGLAIKSELEAYYGEEVNHGRLYPNLDALVEQGLLEKGQLDERTNEYALTDAGRDALDEYFRWAAANHTPDSETCEAICAALSGED
jgi:DNA-binding PadR family transcriptional regulator